MNELPSKAGAGAALLLLAVAACSESRVSHGFQLGDRIVREVTDTVLLVGGTEHDTTLFTPTMLAYVGDRLAVWDRDRSQVVALAADGVVLWRYGTKGNGPGEFAGVTQIAADDERRLWVLDADNARISILDEDGRLVRAFRVPDVGFADRLVPVGDGQALLMGLDPMLHLVDDEGNLVGSKPHPYGSYASLHPISAYNRAIHDADSDSTAFFFYYGGGFVSTDGGLTPAAMLRPYVESVPFPEVTVDRTEAADGSVTTSSSVNASRLAAKAGDADNGVLHLLFQGDTEYGERLIDRYSIGSGEYLGSLLLPDTARVIAVNGDLIAAVVENPFPAVVVRRAP